jgi:hypothetical protein
VATSAVVHYQLCGSRPVASTANHVVQARFVYREVAGSPFGDSFGIFVHDSDSNGGILKCNDSSSGTTFKRPDSQHDAFRHKYNFH